MKKRGSFCGALAGVCAAVVFFTGCGQAVQPAGGLEAHVGTVADISLPDGVQIVGLGEATHGNVELQRVKQEVFEVLVEKEQFRVFALEGDFGGCLRVNEYIHGGDLTAEEAVAEIGFSLYRTGEMAALAEWLRTYNETVPESEQVSFYGFDMQRYDNNKEILFDYLSKVDGAAKETLEGKLAPLTDDTVYTLSKEENQAAADDMKEFLAQMEQNREAYIAASDERSYALAYACAECIWQNATLQAGEVNYQETRDVYMAEKVDTILEIEKGERIMLAGHNGHVQKTSDNLSYTCMGEHLAEQYADAYYVIGTDFISGEVNVGVQDGVQQTVSIELSGGFASQFAGLGGDGCYIDIAEASQEEAIADILGGKQSMISIGDSLSSWQTVLPFFYSTKLVPQDNFDALILYQSVTPTERR